MSKQFFEQMLNLEKEQEAKYIEDIFGRKTDITPYLNRELVMPKIGLDFRTFCKQVWNKEKAILMTLPATQKSVDFIQYDLAPFFAGKVQKLEVFGFDDFFWLIAPQNDQEYLNEFKDFIKEILLKKKEKLVKAISPNISKKLEKLGLMGLSLK